MFSLRAASSLGIASSSSPASCCKILRSLAALHTSSARGVESQRQRTARIVRKTNIERKAERERIREETKPHVVLGTRPGEEAKWRSCDLAKTLVSERELSQPPQTQSLSQIVATPKNLSYGLGGSDGAGTKDDKLSLFFEHLPKASAENEMPEDLRDRLDSVRGRVALLTSGDKKHMGDQQVNEFEKAKQLARVVDLRNANARGIAFENRRRIIAAFSPTGDMSDSGYPEVQVALLTMKIRNVWEHLMQRKKDLSSRRALRMLVHQRAKMLKYIKRVDRDRYDRVLERVALAPESVEGELVI